MTLKLKILISGGGTGGHIFPALSIANEIRDRLPDTKFLFVGAEGRMEMERVPAAGYPIIGLPIIGFPRKPGINTFKFFVNLARSMRSARRVVKQFKPDVVVGVGGYASGPVLRVASSFKVPTLIQEQNSYAGITNRMLARKVNKICVAYDRMERYFPADKIVYTGNPVRKELLLGKEKIEEAKAFYQLDPDKKVLLVVGGSLGARTLNNSMLKALDQLQQANIEVLWQTGKYYYQSVLDATHQLPLQHVHIHEFLTRMDLAYAAADLVISRAGAGTISELSLMGKATILVPSPNVAEDHQTKNARALSDQDAAVLIADHACHEQLIPEAIRLLQLPNELKKLEQNIQKLARPNAAGDIASLVIELAGKYKK
ncbi:MAG: undecaprenyldiphospho-muramoylpentapeptide beta-N-acetylglucosaminyltransferase [Prolixibacteraceae bacterium]|nr:undecaprenyldiphospho-muramoylpentapeptide beta-N-acetylglucosaminyltransferase [Prolixibacteraceae bacterium]